MAVAVVQASSYSSSSTPSLGSSICYGCGCKKTEKKKKKKEARGQELSLWSISNALPRVPRAFFSFFTHSPSLLIPPLTFVLLLPSLEPICCNSLNGNVF